MFLSRVGGGLSPSPLLALSLPLKEGTETALPPLPPLPPLPGMTEKVAQLEGLQRASPGGVSVDGCVFELCVLEV